MNTSLTHLGVADAVLLRQVLLYYESHLTTAPREGESDEVDRAVVQTLNTLRRLDHRLRVYINRVDMLISKAEGETGDDLDLPF